MAKDYYQILGVNSIASAEEIKKAFRKLAMKHHPDRAQDKAAAEAKFKEINEAYAVLGDESKRQQYDMFGSERFSQQFSQDDIFNSQSFGSIQDILGDLGFGGDLFSRIFGGFGSGGRGRGQARSGAGFGGQPFGGGFGGGAAGIRGQDAQSELTISFQQAVMGGERQVQLPQPGGPPRALNVKIPPGTPDGGKLRLRGQGNPAPAGGQPGDLFLQIKVTPDPRFKLRGERDLEVEVAVNVLDLVLGGTADVPTFDRGDKRIKIRPGTQPGTAVRLKGFGAAGSKSQPAGDLYAVLRATVPQQLTSQQKQLFEELRKSGL